MNLYNKAHELASELKINPDVIEFRKASEAVKKNDLSMKMVKDYRELQFEAYGEQMKNGKISEATEKKIQSKASVICMNPDVARYLQAEARFAVIYQDIIKILNDAVGTDINL